MSKKSISFVLALLSLLLCISIAYATDQKEESFVFRDTISWKMSEAEIISIEGNQFIKENDNGMDFIIYSDRKVSSYNAMLAYGFYHNSLALIMYRIEDVSKDKFDNLFLAYTTKYGERKPSGKADYIETIQKLITEPYYLESLNNIDDNSFYEWITLDNTKILFMWEEAETNQIDSCDEYESGAIVGEAEPFNMLVDIYYISPDFSSILNTNDIDLTGI